jgi:hypothetical protein
VTLEKQTRAQVPLYWVCSQHGLANALAALAQRQRSAARMSEALACTRAAVEVYQQRTNTYWLPIAQSRITDMEAEWRKR